MAVETSREGGPGALLAEDRDLPVSPKQSQDLQDRLMVHGKRCDASFGFVEERHQPNQPCHSHSIVQETLVEGGLLQHPSHPGAGGQVWTYPESMQVDRQEQSRVLESLLEHRSDHDKNRAMLVILEEILDRMGPEAALEETLPFDLLRQMLQLHCGMRDIDLEHLRKLFDKCDTDKVHIWLYHLVMCVL